MTRDTTSGGGGAPRRTLRPSRVVWLVALAVVVAVTALAVAQTRSRTESVSTEDGQAASRPSIDGGSDTGGEVGDTSPRFSLATTAGTFAVPTGKPTALLFIASDCPSCIAPAVTLNRIERQLGDRVAVVGIDINPTDTDADLRSFIEKAGNPRYGFAVDRDGGLTTGFGIRAQATVVFTDGAGRVVERMEEESDEAAFRAALAVAGLS